MSETYIVKSNKHYWDKFFKVRFFFTCSISLIPAVLLFTNIFLYAKVAVSFICLIPIIGAYFFTYVPYKKLDELFKFDQEKIKVKVFKEAVMVGDQRGNFYQVQLLQGNIELKHPCEYIHLDLPLNTEIDCHIFQSAGKLNFLLVNEDESLFAIVRRVS